MHPYIRYFSGMAYEFSSALFLINLYYLIRALHRYRLRYLINYSLSLMLVFIFHGGGAIVLIVPSLLIFLHALLSLRLTPKLLLKGISAIVIAAILGNGWLLSIPKYGIPQDFGVAAPFLDRLFGTKQAMKEVASSGTEFVVISQLSPLHLYLLVTISTLFLLLRFRSFFASSFLLIPIGVGFLYFSQNLGFPALVHPYRAVEYLMLSLTIPLAYLILIGEKIVRIVIRGLFRWIAIAIIWVELVGIALFLPKYYETEKFHTYINYTQYSDIPFFLYKIVKGFRPFTWTVVSYVQEYSKVLGKGYMINVNEFITKYDPRAPYLPIPTPWIFIFVEDIPHQYRGSSDWFYRWRADIQTRLKEWIALYGAEHTNIEVFGKTGLLTVYKIDNREYLKRLEERDAHR